MTRIARIAASAAMLAGLANPALAGQACNGSVQASLLQAVPDPLVVALQNARNTAKAKQAAANFTEGLRAAGLTVQLNGASVLHLTFLVTTLGSGGQLHEYSDFSWTAAPVAAGSPPTITVTAGLTSRGMATLLWVASLECRVKTRDPTALAKELGQIIGQVLGKQVDQKAF